MKWFVRFVGFLVALLLVMLLVGSTMPRKHSATAMEVFSSPPEAVWRVMTDFENGPAWRSDLSAISIDDSLMTEVGDNGDVIEYQLDELTPPRRMVIRIVTSDLPYGGSWTYELLPIDSGCRLVLTEDGEIYNPMFRFLYRYLFGTTTTMDSYLQDLKGQIP
ncbi:MAG: SRPBCC family protein [Cytophagales bacterium]|nr:SRPBCC family protein [Cytophagales bacterium]